MTYDPNELQAREFVSGLRRLAYFLERNRAPLSAQRRHDRVPAWRVRAKPVAREVTRIGTALRSEVHHDHHGSGHCRTSKSFGGVSLHGRGHLDQSPRPTTPSCPTTARSTPPTRTRGDEPDAHPRNTRPPMPMRRSRRARRHRLPQVPRPLSLAPPQGPLPRRGGGRTSRVRDHRVSVARSASSTSVDGRACGCPLRSAATTAPASASTTPDSAACAC